MKKKVYRITLKDGSSFTYSSFAKLYSVHKKVLKVVAGTISNSLYRNKGKWSNSDATVERFDIIPSIKDGDSLKEINV